MRRLTAALVAGLALLPVAAQAGSGTRVTISVDPTPVLSAVNWSGSEGGRLAGMIGLFSDADPLPATGYLATVAWGDGLSSAGVVAAATGGGFGIAASHAYVEAGAYPVVVTLRDPDGPSLTAGSTAAIADAALIGVALSASSARNFSGTVAYFFDLDPQAPATNYWATIDWGDGASSAGSVQRAFLNLWQVVGAHRFKSAGHFKIRVAVHDDDGAQILLKGSIRVR